VTSSGGKGPVAKTVGPKSQSSAATHGFSFLPAGLKLPTLAHNPPPRGGAAKIVSSLPPGAILAKGPLDLPPGVEIVQLGEDDSFSGSDDDEFDSDDEYEVVEEEEARPRANDELSRVILGRRSDQPRDLDESDSDSDEEAEESSASDEDGDGEKKAKGGKARKRDEDKDMKKVRHYLYHPLLPMKLTINGTRLARKKQKTRNARRDKSRCPNT